MGNDDASALQQHVVPALPTAEPRTGAGVGEGSEVVRSPTATPWVNDWDLLSPGFQRSMTPMLEVFSAFLVVILLIKRARLFSGVVLFPFKKKSTPSVEENV